MARDTPALRLRRVLVGLRPAGRGQAALRAAAAIAAQTQSELVGVFVEDLDLIHLAGLPFAREVCLPSASTRVIDVPAMERALRAHAEQGRRAMAALAAGTALQWSFRVARGSLVDALLGAAADVDLIVASAATHEWPAWHRAARPRGVLLVGEGARAGAPATAVCLSPLPPAQVRTALDQLAAAPAMRWQLLLLEADPERAQHWAREARAVFGERDVSVLHARDEAELAGLLHALRGPIYVLPEVAPPRSAGEAAPPGAPADDGPAPGRRGRAA